MAAPAQSDEGRIIATLGVGSSVTRFDSDFFGWVHAQLGIKPGAPLPAPLQALYAIPAGQQTFIQIAGALAACGIDPSSLCWFVRNREEA